MTAPGQASRRTRVRRLLLLTATVLALAGAAALLPLESARQAVADIGPAGPVAAVLAGALLIASLTPRTAVTLACGALFGAAEGFWCALAAAVLGATVTYLAGHWAGRGVLCARVNSRLARLDGWLAQRGILAVVVVRLLPLAPYGLIGYAYGTTSVRHRDYFLGTFLGAIPSCFSYAVIGAAVVAPGEINPLVYLPATLGMLVSSMAAWHWRRTARRARMSAAPGPAAGAGPDAAPHAGVPAGAGVDPRLAPAGAGIPAPRPCVPTVATATTMV
ncbi:MAG TPA: TVP38/TMEM64 family protein [Pilimelia sp.]|nr:TVP38/TMEM64 family protein [Pilimelia sp.]